MSILLLNAGSSSLKASLVESSSAKVIAQGLADWAGAVTQYEFTAAGGKSTTDEVTWFDHGTAVARFISDLLQVQPVALANRSEILAVGHRVVHGGPFETSVEITPTVREQIAALADLAPLHNPPSLETLAAAEAELPDIPHIAVFDTAFHSTLAPEAWTYPVPTMWTRDWGIRRFGFHGLSHAYCAQRAAEMLGRPLQELRLVICHLGHGCSVTAVRGGHSVDTTMGFTPLEGLMMGTRSGSIDPSIVLHVQQHHGLTTQQVEVTLNHESGLLGVSGISADMRTVLKAASQGHQSSQLALAVYVHSVRKAIGALAATMGGIDALVFTAGVGENAGQIREMVCRELEFMGLQLDTAANADCRPDADVSLHSSQSRILVIKTREDVTMLREVLSVLGETS